MDKTRDMTYFSHSGDNYDISPRSVYLSEQKDDQRASFALRSFQHNSGY